MTDSHDEDRRNAERRPGDDGAPNQNTVVVLLPEANGSRWTPGKILLSGIVIAVVLLTFGYYGSRQLGWFDLGRQVEARRSGSDAQPTVAETMEEMRQFRNLADSLEIALRRYADRQSDFERNRIDCESLAQSYQNVDSRFVSLSVMLKERGRSLGSDVLSRYRELSGEVDEANRHFDNAGCRMRR